VSAFLLRRLAWAALTLFLVVSLSFGLAYLLPTDPARLVAGPHASPEVIARIRAELRLDQPVSAQYAHYLGQVARGDLGRSFRTQEPVLAAVARALPYTAVLAVGASLVQLAIGLPIGLFAALRRGRPADLLAMAAALVGISAPTFLIGLGLMVGLGFHLDLFPLGGVAPGPLGLLRSAALPSLTLGIAGAAWYSRLMRGEYLEVAALDFMRTARAKGLGEPAVVLRHGLRNALVPVVVFFGVDLGTLLGGAVVTETIFAWPGLGKLAIDSVLEQDIPVMLGAVLVASAAVVLSNLAVDLAQAWLDPRVRPG
jgi:peptide/nickel transport system permease protein